MILTKAWLSVPLFMAFFLAGLQVLIEDYVHDDGNKFAALTLLNFYVIGAAAFGIFMVAKHAFRGAPA